MPQRVVVLARSHSSGQRAGGFVATALFTFSARLQPSNTWSVSSSHVLLPWLVASGPAGGERQCNIIHHGNSVSARRRWAQDEKDTGNKPGNWLSSSLNDCLVD
ncbi:GM19164 [Drosophila sechellia]|uniref:GM19164 n=1 Tax=Drosophila sechellia TaxID=7238 RepID=B4I9I1_DROSE|nr:GM19164 [Drosophila sechellia]